MPGDVSGPVSGRPHTGPGGFAIRVNGAAQGVRANVNFEDTPGFTWSGADNPGQERVDVEARFDGEVLLGSFTGVDLVPGGANPSLIAALPVTRVQVTRVVLVAEDVQAVTVQPSVEVGTASASDDVALNQALALTETGQVQELVLVNPRPSITQVAPFDVLDLLQQVAATATAYVVGARVYGTIVTP